MFFPVREISLIRLYFCFIKAFHDGFETGGRRHGEHAHFIEDLAESPCGASVAEKGHQGDGGGVVRE